MKEALLREAHSSVVGDRLMMKSIVKPSGAYTLNALKCGEDLSVAFSCLSQCRVFLNGL